MEWDTVRSLPWSVLLLIGGGFALAEAFAKSGLARYMATGLYTGLSDSSVYGVMVVLVIVVTLLAVVATAPAVAAVIVPVFAEFALRGIFVKVRFINPLDNVHPFMYCIPATVAVSFSLVLPTSTPISAIIFSTQKIDIRTMAKYGFVMMFIGILLVTLGWLATGQFSFRGKAVYRSH